MGRAVAVVTDSSATLPADVVEKYGVTVVPLQVVLGGQVGSEGVDVSEADVVAALRAQLPVNTSRPSPAAFSAAYQQLADAGTGGVVSVHLSGGLSGTVEAARLAAADAAVPVRVVDSRSTAMGLGYPALLAAELAAADGTLDDVAAAAEAAVERTRTLFYVDSLDALRRGGRIGQAAALVGSALSVKPLLHVDRGRIAVLERVRTTSRALARLEAIAADDAGSGPVDVTVHHLAAAERAAGLADRLRARLPGVQTMQVLPVGAAVAAHVGLGLLAVVIHRR
jgi:DegV family protein with EDD domain